MRITPLSRAVGTILARDVPGGEPGGVPFLRAGVVLTPHYLDSLRRMGVQVVWVDDDLSRGIEPHELVPPHLREQTAIKVAGALTEAQAAFGAARGMSGTAAQELKSVVSRILEAIADNPGTALVLMDMASVDAYTYQHSIDVCALGLLIGRTLFDRRGWEDFRGQRRRDDIPGRLLKLGLGLLLHDAGKLALTPEVVEQLKTATPEEEARLVAGHPEAGARLLDSPAFSPLVRAILREHHERWDGAGYPRGLAGRKINELARIAAVANVYDLLTSDRVNHAALTPAEGVAAIVRGAGTQFDPEIVEVFRSVVDPYPVGSEVTLPDGRVGVVCAVDPEQPDRPLLRLPGPAGFVEERVALDLAA